MDDSTERVTGESRAATGHSGEFPFYDVSGAPYDVGVSYGRAAGEYVHKSISIYQSVFEQKGVSWDKARRLAHDFAPRIAKFSESMLEEIRGIAAGAELPIEDIVAINARTELMYGQNPAVPNCAETDVDGCTAATALPEATADNHMIHGQNWDWRDACADSSIVLRIEPDEGPTMLIFVEAGMLARCGFNSAGVAITGNFLQSDEDYGREGIPIPFIRRSVLMTQSLGEAVRVIYSAPRAFSNNVMISHSGGESINLETTPNEVFWLQSDNGVLVHANHFISEAARAKVRDVGVTTNVDSLYRDKRVRSFLSKRAGELTIDDFKAAFADRYGAPRAVCRSPITGPGGKTSSTVATVIMDTTAQKMWIARRPYDQRDFVEYAL